jgi:hypothetical protein
MRYQWLRWPLSVVFVTFVSLWVYDRVRAIVWVGSTDLEIVFAVTDAAKGEPIPGARVEVRSEGGRYEEDGVSQRDHKQEFVLVAGADGVARKECRNCMCFGRRSGLGFTDTFAVHLPFWEYRVVAEGYEPSEWADLEVSRGQEQRLDGGKSRLVVRVPLCGKRDAR